MKKKSTNYLDLSCLLNHILSEHSYYYLLSKKMFISLQSKSCKRSVQTGFEISRPTWDDFFIKIGPEVICLHLNHFYMKLWTYL